MINNTAIVVLAGGQASRMGGINKALALFEEKPLISHILHHINNITPHIFISANRDLEQMQQFGYPVIPDELAYKGMGPLAGVVSATATLTSEIQYIQIIPCDVPYIPQEVILTLHQHLLDNPQLSIVFAQCLQQFHPAICQMRISHLSTIRKALMYTGKHSFYSIIKPFPHQAITFTNPQWFINCNNTESLKYKQGKIK